MSKIAVFIGKNPIKLTLFHMFIANPVSPLILFQEKYPSFDSFGLEFTHTNPLVNGGF
jgi:hypothetical protein